MVTKSRTDVHECGDLVCYESVSTRHHVHLVQNTIKMYMVMLLNVLIIESGVMKCFVMANVSIKMMVVSAVHV